MEAYEDAVMTCRTEIISVVRDCRRMNRIFTDQDFDLDVGLRSGGNDCLVSLDNSGAELLPGCVRRIADIFDDPRVFVDGCVEGTIVSLEPYRYFEAVLTTLQSRQGLIARIFVARDEQVDAYGLVFFRDGEWYQSIVDGRLYLERPEFSVGQVQQFRITAKSEDLSEREYERMALTGSRALYFAASMESNETAIPLLEKAYARAHGDYGAIQDLYVGDVLEDLTGGVTSESELSGMPNKDQFWSTTLLRRDDIIVFASNRRIETGDGSALENGPAQVAVLKAVEVDGHRLLKLRSSRPDSWQWSGAWSDGSYEWTPEWMMKLNHRFGDDDVTWMSYHDFVRHLNYATVHQIFGADWQITQLWAAFEVPWSQDTLQDVFHVTISAETEVVLVLSQLDPSYFRGLEGQYEFALDFTLSTLDGTRIARAGRRYATHRSNNVRLVLEEGIYVVRPHVIVRKIDASKSVNNTILATSRARQEKLVKVAQSYDLAHAKVANWRAVNETVQYKKLMRLEARRAKQDLLGMGTVPAGVVEGDTSNHTHAPPSLGIEEALGYGDWDAVAALGLRVLVQSGQASIKLERHQSEKPEEKEVQIPAGTTMADYESDEDATEDAEVEPKETLTDVY